MKSSIDQSTLDKLVQSVNEKKNIYGAVFYVSSGDRGMDLISAAGNMEPESPYYIASINKLFISAITLKLYADGRIDINDKISRYLPKEIMQGLHIHTGIDYSNEITIAHLLSQTSGLPCNLTDPQADGKRIMNDLKAGIDQPWPIVKAIQDIKGMNTHFPPGSAGKARYGDTGYQILSLILEFILNDPIQVILNHLFKELGMAHTYVFENVEDYNNFVPMYYKSQQINLPIFLSSTRNDIISTARDQMIFLKAFFNGHFFPKERLPELYKWNNIFFPFKYGIGLEKFYMPRILSPFQAVPDMYGQTGSTGSVAFYIPQMDVYITGTINQLAQPNIAFQTMIKILARL